MVERLLLVEWKCLRAKRLVLSEVYNAYVKVDAFNFI